MLQQAVDRQLVAQETPLELCVVIPTLNEAGNVELLLDKLGIALAGIEWEAIFVDDGSTDGTPEILTRIAQSDRRVRMIRRIRPPRTVLGGSRRRPSLDYAGDRGDRCRPAA
jgi:dolichol-phosphate mannosyltransferase